MSGQLTKIKLIFFTILNGRKTATAFTHKHQNGETKFNCYNSTTVFNRFVEMFNEIKVLSRIWKCVRKMLKTFLSIKSFTILIRITGSWKHFAPQLNNLKIISLKIIVQQIRAECYRKKCIPARTIFTKEIKKILMYFCLFQFYLQNKKQFQPVQTFK